MSRIFLSYNTADRELAHKLARRLRELGHELTVDVDALRPGDNWRDVLMSGLREADGLVVLITERSLQSQFVLSEIGAARAFSQESRTFIIPVVLEGVEIPPVISDLFAVVGKPSDVDDMARRIDEAIAAHQARVAGQSRREDERREKIEEDASPFVEDAIRDLVAREKRSRLLTHFWSGIGFIALAAAAALGYFGLDRVLASGPAAIQQAVLLAFKGLVSVGLLILASRAGFRLATENREEALRNADRIHAINFGKFYLKVFGGQASPEEIREVFEHWNIDSSGGSTPNIDPSELAQTNLTPEMIKATGEVFKAIGAMSKKP